MTCNVSAFGFVWRERVAGRQFSVLGWLLSGSHAGAHLADRLGRGQGFSIFSRLRRFGFVWRFHLSRRGQGIGRNRVFRMSRCGSYSSKTSGLRLSGPSASSLDSRSPWGIKSIDARRLTRSAQSMSLGLVACTTQRAPRKRARIRGCRLRSSSYGVASGGWGLDSGGWGLETGGAM